MRNVSMLSQSILQKEYLHWKKEFLTFKFNITIRLASVDYFIMLISKRNERMLRRH
jgi:hypothetical protein